MPVFHPDQLVGVAPLPVSCGFTSMFAPSTSDGVNAHAELEYFQPCVADHVCAASVSGK